MFRLSRGLFLLKADCGKFFLGVAIIPLYLFFFCSSTDKPHAAKIGLKQNPTKTKRGMVISILRFFKTNLVTPEHNYPWIRNLGRRISKNPRKKN